MATAEKLRVYLTLREAHDPNYPGRVLAPGVECEGTFQDVYSQVVRMFLTKGVDVSNRSFNQAWDGESVYWLCVHEQICIQIQAIL
jgi:hypothetical protein